MGKYIVIGSLLLANNEILSLIVLCAMGVMLICDIAKRAAEEGSR